MKSFLLCLAFLVAIASDRPLLASPAGTNFGFVGPNLFPDKNDWKANAGTATPNSASLQLTAATAASYQRTLLVDPGGEYFFAVDILSPDRVVASIGGLTISYHRQGSHQTICGLVRPTPKGQLDLTISLRSLEAGRSASAELTNFRLQKVERPLVVISKPRNGKTIVVESGAAQSSIIYPSTTKDGKRQAEAVQSVIQAQSGVVVPVVSDTEATEVDWPILKKELRGQNLILIGRLATNRALWSAYNRFLTAEDGYYPGGDGFVVRTAADVFGNGKNHIVLGGSSEGGVQTAVDRFIKILNSLETAPRNSIELPWLLDVELGGKCREAFQADQKVWQNPESPFLPAMTPGYGKVVRWYDNAMGYYWSGLPDYRARAQDYLKIILADRAHTHQYIVEFFIRAFEMLDESPSLTKEEVAQVDSLVLENFLNFLTVTDLSWMTTFSPPYSEIEITNRHQIAPWYADLIMARFLQHHLELGGELKELVEFRLSEKDSAFHAFASSRNGPSMPGIAGSGDYGEFPAVFYRYALENDLYAEFFGSGLARQALSLERFDHTKGLFCFPGSVVDLPDMLGTLAHLTHDGTYRWLAEVLNHPKPERGPFQGRYVADVHHYRIGEDLSPVEPGANWSGIKVVAQPEIADQTESITLGRYPLVSVRGGFKPADDYVAIAGLNPQYPSGVLVRMVLGGQSVFDGVEDGSSGSSRITTNGASALNLSNYNIAGEKQVPQNSVINWKAELPEAWALETDTQISMDITWTRDVVRLARDQYVFADTFKAKRDGKYLLRIAWHGAALIIPEKDHWKINTYNGSTSISLFGSEFAARHVGSSLYTEATLPMKAGDTTTTWTLIQSDPKNSPLWKGALNGQDRLILSHSAKEGEVILHRGPLKTKLGEVSSDLQIMTKGDVSLFGWKEGPNAAPQSRVIPRLNGSTAANTTQDSLKDGWPEAIANALSSLSQAETNFTAASKSPMSPKFSENVPPWSLNWNYDGLLRPTQIQPSANANGIIDFGKTVSLSEIRSYTTERHLWVTTTLPADLKYAVDNGAAAPDSNSPEWKPLEGIRKDRPGVKTGNYGEIHPLPKVDESMFLKDIQLRYLKSGDSTQLKFYSTDKKEARHAVRVRVLRDTPGQEGALIIANTNIFPAFPRVLRDDDFSLSILKSDGKIVAELNPSGPVQSFLVADQSGSGKPEIMILKADGKLDTFSISGAPLSTTDLYGQLVKFDETYGSSNTRQPTGGQRLPFSFGLWRKDAKGASKVIVGRYGTFSFLDQKLNFEGVLIGGPYTNVGFLRKGYDFGRSGHEETLVLERCNLVQIGGDSTPVVNNPQAFNHWPEVYKVESQKLTKDSDTELLSGEVIHEFRVLEKFSGSPRYALVVRGNYLGIYDAKEKQWVFSWAPPGTIRAGALVLETSDKITVQVATIDGILWSISWESRSIGAPSIDIQPLGLDVTEIVGSPALDGDALISSKDGLFLRQEDGKLTRIVPGKFQSADFLSTTPGKRQVIAADLEGMISSFTESKAP